jgi:hypothetical protein
MRRSLALIAGIVAIGAATVAYAGPFTTAPHMRPPQLVDTGWTPKPLRIIAFVPSNYPHPKVLRSFPNAVIHSHWLTQFEQAYNVPLSPPATARGYVVNDMPTLNAVSIATTTFNSWVAQKMDALGIPKRPAFQTIFVLFVPCVPPQNLDSFGCTSHHPSVGTPPPNDPHFTDLDSYATVEKPPADSSRDTRDRLTGTASHEIAEAASNTHGSGWHLNTSDKAHPWLDASPFVEDEGSGNIEAADLTAGSRWFERFRPPGVTKSIRYAYERIYSHAANANGDDPGVPPSPHPYYNVTLRRQWFPLHRGTPRTVKVTGWSTKRIPRWTVDADVVSYTGSKGVTPKPAAPCSLPKTSWKVKNGGRFKMKIKTTSAAKADTWCVVRFKSSRAATSAHGDLSHPWFVGFIIDA